MRSPLSRCLYRLQAWGWTRVVVQNLVNAPEAPGLNLRSALLLKLAGALLAILLCIASILLLNPNDSGKHILVEGYHWEYYFRPLCD